MSDLAPAELIESRIFVLRSQRVIIDSDLAALYGVPTKRLNEQIRRNTRRFPEDFCFQLTADEISTRLRSRSQTATLKRGQNLKYPPYAFTEHGAIQAANILNSDTAVVMSVQVVRAFVNLRQSIVNHKALAAKLTELDTRVGRHDQQLAAIVKAIRHLAAPDGPRHRRKIGFHSGNR